MYLTFSSSTFYPSHSTQFSFLCPLSCLSLSPGHLDERFVCNSFPRCYLRSFPFIRNLLRVRGCLTLSTKSIFCVFVSTFHIIRKFLDFCLNGNQMLDKLVVILSFSLLLLSLSFLVEVINTIIYLSVFVHRKPPNKNCTCIKSKFSWRALLYASPGPSA